MAAWQMVTTAADNGLLTVRGTQQPCHDGQVTHGVMMAGSCLDSEPVHHLCVDGCLVQRV